MQNRERRKTLVKVGEIRPGETSITVSGPTDSLEAIKEKSQRKKKSANQSISVKGYKAMTKWRRKMTLVSLPRGEPLVSMENRRHTLRAPSDDESNYKQVGDSHELNFKSLHSSELKSSSEAKSKESHHSSLLRKKQEAPNGRTAKKSIMITTASKANQKRRTLNLMNQYGIGRDKAKTGAAARLKKSASG